jgi:hypothetical protein
MLGGLYATYCSREDDGVDEGESYGKAVLGTSSVGVQWEIVLWVVVVPARYRASAIAADLVARSGAHSSGNAGSSVVVVACGEHIIERDRTGAVEEACDVHLAGGCCSRARRCCCCCCWAWVRLKRGNSKSTEALHYCRDSKMGTAAARDHRTQW